MARTRDKEHEQKEAAERERVEQQRREGAAALHQARIDEAAKTDEQRTAEVELARTQQEQSAQEERERVAAEQDAAAAKMQQLEQQAAEQYLKLPADARLLKAGTVLHLNGEPCVLPVDAAVVLAGAADEQHFASVLARHAQNFAINAERLRLVYSSMNGALLPLSGQRLALEEMTEQERALFAPPPKRSKP